MPVVKPSFQSESRSESSSSSSYNSLVANLHLCMLVLVVVFGVRHFLKRLFSSKAGPSIKQKDPKFPTRPASWPSSEKSRGVSTTHGDVMSARQQPSMSSGVLEADSAGLVTRGHSKDTAGATTAESSEVLEQSDFEMPPPPEEQTSLPLLSRPRPPPPLTLPELSPTVFSFDDRRRSFSAPAFSTLDTEEFIHQPNPDYIGESSSFAVSHESPSPTRSDSASSPRRRSYTKTVSFATTLSSPGSEEEFAPNSFPSTSPHLPPPADFPELGHSQHEIDVHGEIISSVDNSGHGWTRHTRVYGGGVCLACLQSGGEGGFYGENVRPEDRR